MRDELEDSSDRPGCGVAYGDVRVAQEFDEKRYGLFSDGLDAGGVRPFEHRAEGHDGRFTVLPLGVLDVLADERKDVLDDGVLGTVGEKHQADAGGFARVPVVVVVALLLHGQPLKENGHEILQSTAGVVPARSLRLTVLFLSLK